MEPIRLQCKHCQATLKAPAKLAGKRLKCPRCGQPILVRASAEQEGAENVLPAPPVEAAAAARTAAGQGEPAQKRCPYCRELILATALKCRHCGEFLESTRAATRRPAQRKSHAGELNPAEYVVAILAFPVGLILGLVWRAQRQAKAKKMLQISGLMGLVSAAGLALLLGVIGLLTGGPKRGLTAAEMGERIQNDFTINDIDPRALELPDPMDRIGEAVEELRQLRRPPAEEDLVKEPPAIQRAMRANVRVEVQMLGPDVLPRASEGSGVVLQMEGGLALVLTNRHVVDFQFAQTQARQATPLDQLPTVTLTYVTDDSEPGKVVWVAPEKVDLALVRAPCPRAGVQEAPWRTTSDVRTGDKVFAIGNPVGLAWSYTEGVVSAFRSQPVGGRSIATIQTDTAINPGNSGGGLFNERGELLGINTRIANPRLAQNVGFAIRVTTLQEMTPEDLWLVAGEESALSNAAESAPAEETPASESPTGGAATAVDFASPEAVVTEFLVAMLSGDKDKGLALILPNRDADLLFSSKMTAPPEVIDQLKKRLGVGMKRLEVGHELTLPDGRRIVLSGDDVNENRMHIEVPGNPLPFIVVRQDGKWKVDAGPIIAARKTMLKNAPQQLGEP